MLWLLFASLYALNYHSADKEKEKIDLKKLVDLTEDVKDFTMEENTPPPAAPPEPPKVEVDPQVIKQVDDKQKVDTDFKANDTNKEDNANTAPPKINSTAGVPGGTGTGDEEIENDVQFFAIRTKNLMFEQCKGLPKEEQEKMF